ncbi:Calcyphosin-2, partial [Paragonimus heterotremus]
VPKLKLDGSFDTSDEPVYTLARTRHPAPSDRSLSASTVSWGTESSYRSSRSIVPQQVKPSTVYPPWATHLPVIQSEFKQQSSPENSPEYHHQQDCDTLTERVCTEVENVFREKGQYMPLMNQVNAIERAKPSAQTLHRAILATETRTNFNLHMWFVASLSVFEPADLQPNTNSRAHHIREWRNSISSWNLRNFTGIAFPEDSTWALYETHRIGSGTKALPFLRRAVYHCAWGSRMGQAYVPEIDFVPGTILYVTYAQSEYAPEPLRRFLEHTHDVLRVRIIGVDTTARNKALEAELTRQHLPKDLWYSVIAKLLVARLPLQPALLMQLFQIQASWRRALRNRSRPIEAYLQLYLHYRGEMAHRLTESVTNHKNASKNVDILSRQILEDGLHWFKLPDIQEAALDLLWHTFEVTGGYRGAVHYTDYMRLVFGDLTEFRRQLIVKAFSKLDPNLSGHTKLLDLRRFYAAPVWATKELGSKVFFSSNDLEQVFRQLVASPEKVDFAEFQAFYEATSITLAGCPVDTVTEKSDSTVLAALMQTKLDRLPDINDEQFTRLIRSCWGI